MSFLNKLFGDPNRRALNKLQPIVDKINRLEPEFEKLSDEELRGKTEEFKERLKKTDSSRTSTVGLDDILPEAFAVVREAAKRTLGQRHFDVQLLGGIILHRGEIAEMKTGEGKTLAATLPIYLNALQGKGVHVVTVNDYLAKRDTSWMGPVYNILGLSVGCIQHEEAFVYRPLDNKNFQFSISNFQTNSKSQISNSQKERDQMSNVKCQMSPISRKQVYNCDILYGTNNEFGFDYLRDNMANSIEEMVQRELNYAIVDEIDSILIDEARTPLIISGTAEKSAKMYYQFARLVKTLKEDEDYNIDEKMRAVTLTEKGIAKVEKALGMENIYTQGGMNLVHHLEQALKAETLFKLDRDYVVKKGEVIIVDEFTGRLMYGRRYSEGLHQAIEAKEGVDIKRESITLATITFQNYFRLYKKLAGMTGTAATSAEEFHKVYGLETIVIPTNKPMIRDDKPDVIYKTEQGKFKAIVEEIKTRHEKGQPVLVGTISIEKNEMLGKMLEAEGIPHQILNAKHHEKEAAIISQAGRLGAVTVATNMAGRGVDIILGGKPSENEKFQIPNFEFQINSKSQISKPIPNLSRDSKFPTSYKLQVTSYKEWQQEHDQVVTLGGLHVIGTERHEARRIDNQLRGRAGRQGDPGSSQFYVSMEDDLMRIFGSEKMKGLMNRLGVPDDMPIEHKMVSNAIKAAQKKVEGYNFDLRKYLLEYDDVINKHREIIYRRRREILKNFKSQNSKLKTQILELIENEIEQVVSFHTASEDERDWDLKEIYEIIGTIFPLPKESRIKLEDIQEEAGEASQDTRARTKIIQYLVNLAHKTYDELEERINAQLTNGVQPEAKRSQLANGVPDVADPALFPKVRGKWSLANPMREIEKNIMLRTIDNLWIEHLETMDHLRTGIGLRAYGQREPLIEYKKEAYRAFNELMNLIQKQIVYSIYKIGLAAELAPLVIQRPFDFAQDRPDEIKLTAPAKTMEKVIKQPFSPDNLLVPVSKFIVGQKIGRNQPCPCGSGKKYKKCHGK